jgi:hypothetical protein
MDWEKILNIVRNIGWACILIVFIIFIGWLWEWFVPKGSANVVDMRGCVLPKYQNERVQIENIMRMKGYTDEEVSYSFGCY